MSERFGIAPNRVNLLITFGALTGGSSIEIATVDGTKYEHLKAFIRFKKHSSFDMQARCRMSHDHVTTIKELDHIDKVCV
jgi:hypothetical protein